jgi:hypothetical protein
MQFTEAINLKVIRIVLATLCLAVCAFIVFGLPALANPVIETGEPLVLSAFDYGKAVMLCLILALIVGVASYRQGKEGPFLLALFIGALLIRIMVGLAIYVFNAQDFFGGDALTYDYFGWAQLQGWMGDRYLQSRVTQWLGATSAPGWGMIYLTAAVYALVGRNPLAIQLVSAVIGAATAVVLFLSAQQLFTNLRVSRFAAIAVAFYPSLVLWSSQGLKDGPVVFCLALSVLATLKLGERFTLSYLVLLICALFSLLSLRFYIFYMLVVAIGSAFIIGVRPITATGFVRQTIVIVVLGLSLTYFGVTRYASVQFETYGNLTQIQRSRSDAAMRANSGFGRDVDVSTTEGALSTIPTGLLYLLFAPFPWQLGSLRQNITLPEMIIWWACIPLLVLGVWFSVKYRLRQIFPVVIFTVMLSLAYSLFQGNVGTAYRQRAQLLVFYFIFVAVGYVLMLEKREEKKLQESTSRESILQTELHRYREIRRSR